MNTLNVFGDLEQGIEMRVAAWLLPARYAQIVGMIGHLVEKRIEAESEEAFSFRLAKAIQKTWELRFPLALILAATVLDKLITEGSTILAPFDKQLAEAKVNGGDLPTGTPTPPPAVPSLPATPTDPVITAKPPGMLTQIIGAPSGIKPKAPTT